MYRSPDQNCVPKMYHLCLPSLCTSLVCLCIRFIPAFIHTKVASTLLSLILLPFSLFPYCIQKLWRIACPSWDVGFKKTIPILLELVCSILQDRRKRWAGWQTNGGTYLSAKRGNVNMRKRWKWIRLVVGWLGGAWVAKIM